MIIKYNRVVQSGAMSKAPKQNGLVLTNVENDVICIEATNPKTNDITSHLYMEIPVESLGEVINELINLQREINKK